MDYQLTVTATDSILELCKFDNLLVELKDDFLRSAIRYSRIRSDWFLVAPKKRRALEDERKRAHNALIDSCNILSRTMVNKGLDIEWRAKLGNERKRIGDFACYIHAYLGIMAR